MLLKKLRRYNMGKNKLFAILFVAGVLMFLSPWKATTAGPNVPPLDITQFEKVELADGADFTYPVDKVSDGKVHYFIYNKGTSPVRFFIVKSSDGAIRAAFDTCDVCFRWKLGYYQNGDLMVCRRCGQTFPSSKINEVKGGCNPAPLDRKINGKNLVILRKNIEEGAFYFQ